ncbi:MAG TPA: hypothetical protein EYO51_00885 [Methylococcaceae bacterium]|jgi:hypothetical protein|nr:hypothetical protein [Methylococcaceae bacterium]HIN68442.1 hypothetical protein [Methylococcales bacterium]HIA45341.1 hypothetical protein [Methylococcaceae bacterium]HIB61715.1 hypothetical protein [Methylococcaceae bacterium]HIO12888.1 hypothetical protein [Methylococcales bacterium]
MKKLFILLICLTAMLSIGCSGERQINGRTSKLAFKSVRVMKEYLPKRQKLEFEIAFWTMKNGFDTNSEFLDTVDGKTSAELIAAGKTKFAELHESGRPEYTKFSDWDAMIKSYEEERFEQDMHQIKDKEQRKRDSTNNILYDLH